MATRKTRRRTSPAKPANSTKTKKGKTRPAGKTVRKPTKKTAPAHRRQTKAEVVPAPANINRIDRQLLILLQADGRQSNLALAKAVGLSPAACHDRVRKLVSRGLVTHFSAHLNAPALDAGQVVFALIELNRDQPDAADKLARIAADNPWILECHLVAGSADVLIKSRVSDLAGYQQLLENVISPVPGVSRVISLAGLQTLKETSAIAI